MLVTSTIDNSKWLWINIPKTASTLIRNAILNNVNEMEGQVHYTYLENVELYGRHTGFTVVRDPMTRFISGLNHVFSECACGKCILLYDRPPKTEEIIQFLNDIVTLSKNINNFHYKTYYNGHDLLWMDIVKSLQKYCIKSKVIYDPVNCVMWSFILPQYLYLDGMEVRDYIFRYEDLKACAKFVDNTLGYKVNLQKRVRNYSYKLNDVDFDSVELKELIYQYYEEDYKQLNY